MAKITHQELSLRLEGLRMGIEQNITSINYGGCGVLAGIVGKALQGLDVPCDVATPTWSESNVPANVRAAVKKPKSPLDWDRNGLSRRHMVVRFRLDGQTSTWDGVWGLGDADEVGEWGRTVAEFGDGLTVRECVGMCAAQTGWNRSFDRKQIPKLKALVAFHITHGLGA